MMGEAAHRLRLLRHVIGTHTPTRFARRIIATPSNKTNYYFLLEFPKCGRTWLRYMINQAESMSKGVPLLNTLHGVGYPEFNLPRARYIHGFHAGQPLAHHTTTVSAGRRGLRGVILLVRRPDAVMVSYYHQCVYRDRNYFGDLKAFIRDPHFGIRQYAAFLTHFARELENNNHLIVRYEDILADPKEVLTQVLQFINLELPNAAVEEIVRVSSFERMRDVEANASFWIPWWLRNPSRDPKARKMRSGGSEDLKAYLDEHDLAFIQSTVNTQPVFAKLGIADQSG